MTDPKEAPIAIGVVMNQPVKRNLTNQEAHHTQADRLRMTDPKEAPIAIGVVMSRLERRKPSNQEVRLILADLLLMIALKEAPIAIGVAKDQPIKNLHPGHQNLVDLKNVATILITNHSASRKIHHTTSLKLNAVQTINQRCAAGKNQQPIQA
jgi:hypothetical protein